MSMEMTNSLWKDICKCPANPRSAPSSTSQPTTVSYLVADPETKRAAVIDPVLDYDHASGKASTKSAA